MKIFKYILVALSFAVLSAHFMRSGEYGLMLAVIIMPFLLITKKRWVLYIVALTLLFSSLEWFVTAYQMYQIRVAIQMPATRMFIIMGSAGIFTILSAAMLITKSIRNSYKATKYDIPILILIIILITIYATFLGLGRI